MVVDYDTLIKPESDDEKVSIGTFNGKQKNEGDPIFNYQSARQGHQKIP
jgi:hypothetical protein